MVQQRGTKLLFFLGGVKHHSMGCSVIFIRITQSRRRKKKERRKKKKKKEEQQEEGRRRRKKKKEEEEEEEQQTIKIDKNKKIYYY